MNILDFIFPKKCLECGSFGKYICDNCLKKVGKSGWWGRNYSVFKYEGVIRKAIIALKYKYSTAIVDELSSIIVSRMQNMEFRIQNIMLIPVPLHQKRFNERGFNQSEEVGKLIAKSMGWDFNANLLIKNKNTKHQVGLKGAERRQNLSNVFSLNSAFRIPDSSIVVFDDVMTTGSTLSEAKKALEKAGFKNVWGLTIAR